MRPRFVRTTIVYSRPAGCETTPRAPAAALASSIGVRRMMLVVRSPAPTKLERRSSVGSTGAM